MADSPSSSSSREGGNLAGSSSSRLENLDPIERIMYRRVKCRAHAENGEWAEFERESRLMVDEDDAHFVSIYVGIASAICHQERRAASSPTLPPASARADEALNWIDRSLRLPAFGEADEQGVVEAHRLRGDILLEARRDLRGGLRAYEEVLKRCPDDAETSIKLQQLYRILL
jgi:hypothetical protein